jgi:hypothetical protein
VNAEQSDTEEPGRAPGGPSRSEPSAAEASRALAQRIARADVAAQGSVPFRSPSEPQPDGRRGRRLVLLVAAAVLAAALALAIVLALVVS